MFNLIIVTFLSIVSIALAYFGVSNSVEELTVCGMILGIISFVWFVSSTISNFTHYTDQIRNFQNLQGSINNYSRYKEMQDKLLVELKHYLGSAYPDIEKDIFRSINDAKGDINVVLNYPEIKSSAILSELSKRIKEIYERLFDLQSSIERTCSDIRYYNLSKWEYLKPSIPEKLNPVIFTELSM